MITRLFRINQASHECIPYIIYGLRWHWTSADYEFGSEFDSKTGDYYVTLKTNYEVPEPILKKIKEAALERK